MNLRDIFLAGAFAQGGGGAVSPEQITEAVNNYLDKNPVGVDLAMTGAAVGQIAKITEVDASGVPTAWEPVDMPSGGGSEEWEHICDISVVEDTETPVNTITQDLGAEYKKLYILVDKQSSGGLVGGGSDSYPLRIYANSQDNKNVVGVFGTAVMSSGWSVYSCEIEYNEGVGIITGWSSIGVTPHFKNVNTRTKGTMNKLIFFCNSVDKGFYTFTIQVYGVRA